MPGNLLQVGTDNRLRISSDSKIVVGGSLDPCCCESYETGSPGYAIYARDCCNGSIQASIYLDLTHPPTNAFTKRFYVPGGNCIRFDPGDVATAILMTDPGFTGTIDFLAVGFYSWDRYNTCTACRCAHGSEPCCYDDIDHPSATVRTGQSYWTFSGITVLSDITACHPSAYTETDGVTQTYQKVTKLVTPTGPYTSQYNGGWIDGDCDPNYRPDPEVIVTYYHGAGCSTPSDNRSPATDYLTIIPEAIILPGIVHYSGDSYTNLNVFDSTSGYVTPSADAWVPCDGTVVFPDSGYTGTRPGGGGSVTLYTCCPDEPGGV